MKNILIVLVLLLGCSKKETENIKVYKVLVRFVGTEDSPSNQIILTNRNPDKNYFPVVNYQADKEDLMKIEKICHLKESERMMNKNALVLVQINKDNKVERYYFNQKNGIEILERIEKIASHYNNDRLSDNLATLQIVTKENRWLKKRRLK